MKFTLSITLGNETMETPLDVAEALRKVADRLDNLSNDWGDCGGLIRDLNGNLVGKWEV